VLSKKEQKARLAELKSKAAAKGEAHGEILKKARIAIGQKLGLTSKATPEESSMRGKEDTTARINADEKAASAKAEAAGEAVNKGSERFERVYATFAPKVGDARLALNALEERYSKKAKEIGYLPLAGVTTASGLLGLLSISQGKNGRIDPSKLPENIREAFELQYPNLHESDALSGMSLDEVRPLVSGWVGKLTEIMVRDKLNSGEPISGFRLGDGEVARLAADSTQEGWDIRVEPSGQLIQVKSTSDLGYVRASAQDIDDEGIIFITTDLPGNPNLDDLNMLLLEMDESKEQLLGMFSGAITDSIDDFDILSDVLGPLAIIFSAGTGALLIRTAYNEYRAHGSIALIRRRYGPQVVGKLAAMISPIPLTGWALRRWINARMSMSEALRTARTRIARVDRLIGTLKYV